MSDVATAPVEAPETAPEVHPDQPVSINIGDIEVTGAGGTEAELQEGLPTTPVEAPVAPEKVSRGKKRFSQITSERDQEAHKRAEAERERDELKARIAALESRAPSPAPVPAAVSPAVPVPSPQFTYPTYAEASAKDPSLDWEVWNDGKQRAIAKWEYQQSQSDIDARIRRSIEADRASRAFETTTKSTVERGRASYADFDAVLKRGGTGMIGPTPESDFQRAQLVYQQPNAEHLIYAIARDPQVVQALANMSDVQFGMALASLAPASGVVSPASTSAAVPSLPPPPMQPVGSGSKTAVPSAVDIAERAGEDYDSSGFREQIRKERGRR